MAATLTEKSKDRRIARTRQAIRMALFRLIGSHDWQDISISKLCHEADVARSTFYLHYASPTAVLDESISEIVAAFSVDSTSTIPVLEWLVDHVAANRAIFQRTTDGSQTNFIIDRFKAGIVAAFEMEQGRVDDKTSGIRTAMIVGGAFQALLFWSKRWDLNEIVQLKSEIRHLEHFALVSRR